LEKKYESFVKHSERKFELLLEQNQEKCDILSKESEKWKEIGTKSLEIIQEREQEITKQLESLKKESELEKLRLSTENQKLLSEV